MNITTPLTYGFSSIRIKPTSFKSDVPRTRNGGDVFVSTTKPDKGRIYKGEKIYNITSTEFFRRDINWRHFGKFLKDRFEEAEKVNTYVFGSSKGDEVFTLSAVLQGRFGENSSKFFPIMPSDIEEENVKKANETLNNGKLTFYYNDYDNSYGTKYRLERIVKECDCEDLFYIRNDMFAGDFACFMLQPIKNSIAPFERKNFLNEVQNLDSENPSLILCRNMWPYVSGEEYDKFAQNLYEKLKDGSCIVIGDVDYDKDFVKNNALISDALINAGFKAVEDNLLKTEYQKKPYIFVK